MLDDRISREKVFWNQVYKPTEYAGWQEPSWEVWRNAPFRRRALDYLGPLAGKRVLCCGVGREAVVFARQGAEVYGFDISENMIISLQSLVDKAGLTARLTAQPFEKMEYPDEFFDMAFGMAIVHHVDLEVGAKELRRVLKPGARGAFIEPLGTNPFLMFARRYLPYRGKERTPDERPLSYDEIDTFVRGFKSSIREESDLLGMLNYRVLTNQRIVSALRTADRFLLSRAPMLRRFCARIWIGVEK